MFKKILFATSATPSCDDAARVAFELGQRYGAKVLVFHVLGTPTRAYSQTVKDIKTGDEVTVDQDYLDLVHEEVRAYYEKQLAGCDDYSIEIVSGYPHREILRMARNEDVDLVIMGATNKDDGKVYRLDVAGDTLQRVAKAARCPVLTINRPAASYWGGISNIVFGTDFSKASDSAFTFAYKMAKEVGGELNLFHSLDITSIHAGKSLGQDEIEDKLIEARNKMRSKYVSQMEDFTNWDIEVWEGVPYVEIVKFARERQADLIVMAHSTREVDPESGALGSTMEQVIMRANCPVVSVNRPDKV